MYAISMHAVQIVLLHNHPSGDATPSREDYLVTQNIYAAGKILDIMLADHIILGNQEYFSFLEHQVSPFCGNTEGGN